MVNFDRLAKAIGFATHLSGTTDLPVVRRKSYRTTRLAVNPRGLPATLIFLFKYYL